MNLTQYIRLAQLAARYYPITLKKIYYRLPILLGRSNATAFPRLVNLFLFPTCNLKCVMCGQWRLREKSKNSNARIEYLPLTKLKQIIDEAARYNSEIYIWGGEPTLHPDFIDLVNHIKQRGLTCTINTNGTYLNTLADKLTLSAIDSIDVSLDGPAAVHDAIRGVPGTYSKVMSGLRRLNHPSKKRPLVKIIITLSEYNLAHVETLLNELEQNPAVDLSIIQLGWYVTQTAGKRYEARLRRDYDLPADSWYGFQDDDTAERAAPVRRLIENIQKGSYKKPILVFPDLSPKQIEAYYKNHGELFGKKGCPAMYREVNIRPNGDVVICMDYADIAVGSVYDQSLKDIWQGGSLAFMRQNIEQKGLFSVCSRCCGFFR